MHPRSAGWLAGLLVLGSGGAGFASPGASGVFFEPSGGDAFVGRGTAYPVALGRDGQAAVGLPDAVVTLRPLAAASTVGAGEDRRSSVTHDLRGSDPARWRTNVPNYGRVRYAAVYPGIDLVYHAAGRRLEFDLEVAPGADPGLATFALDGVDRIELDGSGDAIACAGGSELRLHAPRVYVGGGTEEVCSRFRVVEDASGVNLGIDVGPFDGRRGLVIDPVISYASYLGGSGDEFTNSYAEEQGPSVAVDASGAIYVAGTTESTDFPLAQPLQGTPGGSLDGFITKLAPGGALVFSTYLGGSSADYLMDIAVDAAGAVYVTGTTWSTDFPVTAPFQASNGGGCDVVVAKLDPTGASLVYSTYLGGGGWDYGMAVAVDAQGSVHVAGNTPGPFPGTTECQGTDAFMTKLDPSGQALVYARCYGGDVFPGCDPCEKYSHAEIALAGNGDAWVVGTFLSESSHGTSSWFLLTRYDGSGNTSGPGIGGGWYDQGMDVALGTAGGVFVLTRTELYGAGTSLTLGGSSLTSLASDGAGVLTVVGKAGTPSDVFIGRVDEQLQPISTALLGGSGSDAASDVVATPSGAVVAGTTSSTDFPVVLPQQGTLGGGQDAFVAAVRPCFDVGPRLLPDGRVGAAYGTTLTPTGGTPPHSFSAVSGVPPGLSLGGSGVLSGTPTAPGRYLVRVLTVDAAGCAEDTRHGIDICGNLTIAPIPDAVQTVPYARNLSTAGGVAPYTYALIGGSLPPDLTLTSSGRLSGTPRIPGTYTFDVEATDSIGCTGARSFTMRVCPFIDVTPIALPPGRVGAPYAATLSATPSNVSHTFSTNPADLPPGVSLSGSGILSGTPLTSGSYTFDVTASDATGCSGTRSLATVVNDAGCPDVTVLPTALPAPVLFTNYDETLTATGGLAPYTFRIAAGRLPNYLALSPSGRIQGLVSDVGGFEVAIAATDDSGCTGQRIYRLDMGEALVGGLGHGPGNPNRVSVFRVGSPGDFYAYGAGTWGVNVGAGQMDTGFPEVLTGPGPGPVHGPTVKAFRRDTTPMAKIHYYAYATLRYGVNVTAAQVDADGFDEILTGAGPGSVFGPHLRGWSFDAVRLQPITKINAFVYSTLKYGVDAGAADVETDAFEEILTGPGPGPTFAPLVRGFDYDGATLAAIGRIYFWAFATLAYGVHVDGGDVEPDGFDEIVAGAGAGPTLGSEVAGFDYDGASVTPTPGFRVTAFPGSVYGARVCIGNVRGHGKDYLVAACGPDPTAPAEAQASEYKAASGTFYRWYVFSPFPGFGYGMTVSSGAFGY